MVHYTCDCCKCPLDSENDLRYVLRMEIYAAIDESEEGSGIGNDVDSDNLQEIQNLLDEIDGSDEQFSEDVYKQLRFDLCADCRQRILRDPVGRHTAAQFNFSEN